MDLVQLLLVIEVTLPEEAVIIFCAVISRRYVFDLEDAWRVGGVRVELLREAILFLLEYAVRKTGCGNLLIIHSELLVVQIIFDLFTQSFHTGL